MNASDLYTCSTAAAELGVTPTRVRALIAAKRLCATFVGHVWLIEPAALDAVRSRKPGRPPRKKKEPVKAPQALIEQATTRKVRHWMD